LKKAEAQRCGITLLKKQLVLCFRPRADYSHV